jgi:Putative GTPases (G3E family)
MEPFIDLYLISGFLGAGKTTFLQHLINNFKEKRLGIIVNEFGAISIDGKIIKHDGIKLVEINNGSIFCSCLKSNFVSTLISFSKQPIDVLIIENSGLADPSNMKNLLEEMKKRSGRLYNYRGSICIVDPLKFLKNVKILTPIQNQVISSKMIIINKTDLVDTNILEAIENKVLELNPEAVIYKTSYGNVPAQVLDEKLRDNGFVGQTSNNEFNRPATYTIECEGSFEKEDILDFIDRIHSFTFRIKGFLNAGQEDSVAVWWKIDAVEDQVNIEITELNKDDIQEAGKLVIIGRSPREFIDQVELAWKDIFGSEIYIYI